MKNDIQEGYSNAWIFLSMIIVGVIIWLLSFIIILSGCSSSSDDYIQKTKAEQTRWMDSVLNDNNNDTVKINRTYNPDKIWFNPDTTIDSIQKEQDMWMDTTLQGLQKLFNKQKQE